MSLDATRRRINLSEFFHYLRQQNKTKTYDTRNGKQICPNVSFCRYSSCVNKTTRKNVT
eukprot:TRINITY_DN1035_c0_g1_i1.p2 TRINITY_DN1035_c0_g1~~TRINITY_DN1035_c0_g1_i1.p2  ORF type:complete len:59 (+),score=6.16 TRINITY_DN1035_c0_g1_i1:91-267(+)